MKTVLIINSSVSPGTSVSRTLTGRLVEYLEAVPHRYEILQRDLAVENIAHICQSWIAADARPAVERDEEERQILSLSDNYITELRGSDIIFLAVPMYNWSIPSTLKCYLDQVLRVQETFSRDPTPDGGRHVGHLTGKRLVLLMVRGSQGYQPGGRNAHMDFQSGYLKMVFGIMGISEVDEIILEGINGDRPGISEKIESAWRELYGLIGKG